PPAHAAILPAVCWHSPGRRRSRAPAVPKLPGRLWPAHELLTAPSRVWDSAGPAASSDQSGRPKAPAAARRDDLLGCCSSGVYDYWQPDRDGRQADLLPAAGARAAGGAALQLAMAARLGGA